MAFAYGVGAHVGFGLGFLNFIGTILFFVFLFMLFKMIFRGMRYGAARGGWSSRGWGGPWGRYGGEGRSGHDEAMSTARERFAEGAIDADAFAGIKQALDADRPASDEGWSPRRHDRALQLARMRLARGEITPEEFEAVRKTLIG